MGNKPAKVPFPFDDDDSSLLNKEPEQPKLSPLTREQFEANLANQRAHQRAVMFGSYHKLCKIIVCTLDVILRNFDINQEIDGNMWFVAIGYKPNNTSSINFVQFRNENPDVAWWAPVTEFLDQFGFKFVFVDATWRDEHVIPPDLPDSLKYYSRMYYFPKKQMVYLGYPSNVEPLMFKKSNNNSVMFCNYKNFCPMAINLTTKTVTLYG